jgi:dipeptidyl aminopeptidase/acylaminoacyl peptidase
MSPDGEQFAFVSGRSGHEEIWISRRDGQPVPLTTLWASLTGTPRWSPDGGRIAFDSRAGGGSAIYVIDWKGGTPRQVTAESFGAYEPAWSPDGTWLYFTSSSSGQRDIWKAPVTGGVPERVTHMGANEAMPAANGLVYFTKDVPGASGTIWSVPAAGGPERPVPQLTEFGGITRSWGVLREGIYFLSKDELSRQVVRFLSFRTNRVTALFAIPKETMWDVPAVALSQDGRYALIVQLDHRINDLVMIDHFR